MNKENYQNPFHITQAKKIKLNSRKSLFKIGGMICASLLIGATVLSLSFTFIDSPKERQLQEELNQMTLQYKLLDERMNKVTDVLQDMREKDDQVYRAVLNAEPVSSDIRQAGSGGVDLFHNIEHLKNSELLISSTKKLDEISKSLLVQSESYEELLSLAHEKSEMLASIPGIAPLNSKHLTKGVSGFGSRMHPIYRIYKGHTGIDFPAPRGTPIYATGNGKITVAGWEKGYGRTVKIDHGFGYETLYGHMSKLEVKKNQKVSRGQVIGYVGNTGVSSGSHLHYEVIKNKKHVNPVDFFTTILLLVNTPQ